MKINDFQGHSIDISEAEYKEKMSVCEKCKFADAHFDFIDCPYDCENDIEHYKLKHPEGVRYE